MSSIFCCTNPQPYKNRILDHEPKFREFLTWGSYPKDSSIEDADPSPQHDTFVIQVVRQVNYGPLESKRYFLRVAPGSFVEVGERWLVEANLQKLNS